MIVNWALLKNPVNWVIVTLMVLIAAIGVHFALTFFASQSSATRNKKS